MELDGSTGGMYRLAACLNGHAEAGPEFASYRQAVSHVAALVRLHAAAANLHAIELQTRAPASGTDVPTARADFRLHARNGDWHAVETWGPEVIGRILEQARTAGAPGAGPAVGACAHRAAARDAPAAEAVRALRAIHPRAVRSARPHQRQPGLAPSEVMPAPERRQAPGRRGGPGHRWQIAAALAVAGRGWVGLVLALTGGRGAGALDFPLDTQAAVATTLPFDSRAGATARARSAADRAARHDVAGEHPAANRPGTHEPVMPSPFSQRASVMAPPGTQPASGVQPGQRGPGPSVRPLRFQAVQLRDKRDYQPKK